MLMNHIKIPRTSNARPYKIIHENHFVGEGLRALPCLPCEFTPQSRLCGDPIIGEVSIAD